MARVLFGSGAVRPRVDTSWEKLPLTDASLATTPLGPSVAHASSAASSSLSRADGRSDTQCCGPSACVIARPVTGCCSVRPESTR